VELLENENNSMKLFIFDKVLCDYTDGCACIAAESHQEACEIFLKCFTSSSSDLSSYQVLPLADSYTEKHVVHYKYGGG